MGVNTKCGRCSANFYCSEMLYCDYCKTYFNLKNDNEELNKRFIKEIENKNKEINNNALLNKQLSEKDQLIENLKKKLDELEIKLENNQTIQTELIENNEDNHSNHSDSNYSLVEENN